MRALALALALAAGAGGGCGTDTAEGPFAGLPLDARIEVDGLDGTIHIARDRFGIAHVAATTLRDAVFAQGYVMAHDRLPQLDVMRRFAGGTLAELYGAVDPRVVETDLEMRMHRMRRHAEQTWAALQASSDPADVHIVELLTRFSDGVTAYLRDVQEDTWVVDAKLRDVFAPALTPDWTPVDSLLVLRFHTFAMSWTAPSELARTELYQKLRATYETGAATPRTGITADLMTFTPVGTRAPLAGFPGMAATGAPPPIGPARPEVPQLLLDRARAFFADHAGTGPAGGPGPHAFLHPFAGSNAFAIGPRLTGAQELAGPDTAILAADLQHVLANPSSLYPTHLIVQPDPTSSVTLELVGLALPGVPGVLIGSNGQLAWTTMVSGHDVNDVYLETIVPCAGASCTLRGTAQLPIETVTEDIRIGDRGLIGETRTVTYEYVADHGPIIPELANGTLVPRSSTTALSIRYAGYTESFEIRTLAQLFDAPGVDAGLQAVTHGAHGGDWMFIDVHGELAWTTQPAIPVRERGAYEWAPGAPDGAAPFFVLDGAGGHEWIGQMLPEHVPQVLAPADDLLVTADADPVGATHDGDPLDQRAADGQALYAGVAYAPGLRADRIATLIAATPQPITASGMERVQHDSSSTVGARLAPRVIAALRLLDDATGAPGDVAPYLASLTAEQRLRLTDARALLDAWTFETPTALVGPDASSAATLLFNTWIHFFARAAIADELTQADFAIERLDDAQLVRVLAGVLLRPGERVRSATTGEPILCDRLASPADESCTRLILETMLQALTQLESAGALDDGRWGRAHHLTLAPLLHDPERLLELPVPGEAPEGGFPRRGDNFVIDRADPGLGDLDLSLRVGVAHRFVASSDVDLVGRRTIRVRLGLAGGVVFDRHDPHYRDVLDEHHLAGDLFAVPIELADITRQGESRWELR